MSAPSRGPAAGRPADAGAGRRRAGRRRRGAERSMVPDAHFTSYYGRPVLKAAPWTADIPAYLFLGGLSGGSALLAAGADLTDRPALRRVTRIGAAGSIVASLALLVHDLGKPSRFVNMLRVAKPTSPMSVGTWVLTLYGPLAGLSAAAELPQLVPRRLQPLAGLLRLAARPAGLGAAVLAPAVASYTAVLLADTATPAWHEARHELPFVFIGSAAGAAGGLGLIAAPVSEAGPARRLAVAGTVIELVAERRMEASMGLAAETLHEGTAGTLMRASTVLTTAGALGTVVAARSRLAAAVSGAALIAGSACARFGIFHAGQQSARDPKYTVVPQRERLDARNSS